MKVSHYAFPASNLAGKDCDFFGHPKLQTVDSLSSAINAHRNHRHQNLIPQI
jgi:hypothetical protein